MNDFAFNVLLVVAPICIICGIILACIGIKNKIKEKRTGNVLEAFYARERIIHSKTPHRTTTKNNNELYNTMELCEPLRWRKAYFKNGTVYAINDQKRFVIGYYDNDGIVYNENKYEIGSVNGELIMMNRLGDFKEYRESLYHKSEEKDLTKAEREMYYPIAKKTEIAWCVAEISLYDSCFGSISEFSTSGNLIARPLYYTHNNKSAVGYGACFLCLEYLNGYNCGGKYASFYTPIGQKWIAPY